MQPLSAMIGATVVVLLGSGSWAAKPQSIPQFINVVGPEAYPALLPPLNQTVYPHGSTACQATIRNLIQLSDACLYNGTNPQSVQRYCFDADGCRQSLMEPVRDLVDVCVAQPASYANIAALFDQIAFHTGASCPNTNESYDIQARLVLRMLELDLGQPGSRPYQCSDGVRKGFGRMALADPFRNWDVVWAKSQCNKDAGQYCRVEGSAPVTHLCHPCNQRYFAQRIAVSDLHGVRADGEIGMVRACYDDGDGNSCYSKVAGVLHDRHGVRIQDDMTFAAFGALDVCTGADACRQPACVELIKTIISEVGCCAPTLPLLLIRNRITLHCANDMLESRRAMDTACFDPFTYWVDIQVKTTDPIPVVCRAVRADLATTLAMLPELITCEEASDSPSSDPLTRTVRATIVRFRSIGMPSMMPFDPDLLQSPVLSVSTSAILD